MTEKENFRELGTEDPDGLYQELLSAHEGLEDEASKRLDAALVITLAVKIGDREFLREAINLSREAALLQSVDQ